MEPKLKFVHYFPCHECGSAPGIRCCSPSGVYTARVHAKRQAYANGLGPSGRRTGSYVPLTGTKLDQYNADYAVAAEMLATASGK